MTETEDHHASAEPVAVIGLSCRLPQASGPTALWELLRSGVDAVTEVPRGRWDPADVPEHRFGGFLDDIDQFDAAFFGISPREAAAMDPQQRLVLELSWEALEHARIVAADLKGTRTGVFVGAIWDDYAALHHRYGGGVIDRYAMTGLHRGIIANRVSYLLGLRGPSMVVDAAQSSSFGGRVPGVREPAPRRLDPGHRRWRQPQPGRRQHGDRRAVRWAVPGRALLHVRLPRQRFRPGRRRWPGRPQAAVSRPGRW